MQYVVSVQNIDGHMCGGFLVTEDFVVTAAHCDVENPTHVVLGSHNIKKGYQINIEKKFKHPSYSNIWLGNDIMLLKVSMYSCKQRFQVAGWGKNRTGGENVDDLRVVSVSVINQYVCREQWPGLSANVICAGGYGTNKGFCQGDSGAPLVCNGLVVGLASFNKNYNCAYPDVPNIYTDISKYLKWINGILLTATSS
uniref:Peptidase S1 domain-containing protein n=1 Tax=Oreochromis aureus TaxID=47969 RepID=A0A668UVG7_OREAU